LFNCESLLVYFYQKKISCLLIIINKKIYGYWFIKNYGQYFDQIYFFFLSEINYFICMQQVQTNFTRLTWKKKVILNYFLIKKIQDLLKKKKKKHDSHLSYRVMAHGHSSWVQKLHSVFKKKKKSTVLGQSSSVHALSWHPHWAVVDSHRQKGWQPPQAPCSICNR
jgi:hypothetical protein